MHKTSVVPDESRQPDAIRMVKTLFERSRRGSSSRISALHFHASVPRPAVSLAVFDALGLHDGKRLVLPRTISYANDVRLSPSLITWLRSFEATARHRSFTRAAAELHLTQSAVSQQVRHLERHLECKLFHRLPGELALSRFGHRLFSEVGPALQRLEKAVSGIRTPEAPLHVSCSPSFANRWLMPRLGRFLRLHPEIDLHLRAEFHSLTSENFVREGMHAAIRYDPLEYPDLQAETLMDEYLLPVASADFVAGRPDDVSALDSPDVTLLHDSEPWDGAPNNVEWQTILDKLGKPKANAFRCCSFNMAELALASARAGEGIAAARLALVLDDLENKRLIPVESRPVPARSRYVLLAMDVDDTRVEALRDWLRDECIAFRSRCRPFLAPAPEPATAQAGTRSEQH